jgi:7-cyano-7-deazaguanine synthase
LATESVCVLASGGVDSAVLIWHEAQQGATVHPVYVKAGMAWESVERRWLERYLDAVASPRIQPLTALDFPMGDVYGSHWSVIGSGPSYDAPDEAVYLPGRNVILVAKTAVYCALNQIDRIALGTLAGNPFPDATPAFFDGFADVLSRALGQPIRIERPFGGLRKVDVVRRGASLPLHLTFSCVKPVGELHCGDCNKCAERQRGFAEADVADRTTYATVRSPE